MKKLALILALLLAFASACAEGLDFASMEDETLQAVIEGAQAELKNRGAQSADDGVLVDQDGCKVYLTGNYEVYGSDSCYLELEAIVENDSDRNICFDVQSASINDWQVYGSGIYNTGAGKKQKGTLVFCISDANIVSYEEIEDMEVIFYIFDGESYETIKVLEPIQLNL